MSDITKRLIPGLLMLVALAAWASYPAVKTYFSAVLAFTAAERADAASHSGVAELGTKLDASHGEIKQLITAAVLIGQAEHAQIFNTMVAGFEEMRRDTQRLRGEVAALSEQMRPQAPQAPAAKKPARKPPQAPTGPFSFFPTSWEPTISWEATVVDLRPPSR